MANRIILGTVALGLVLVSACGGGGPVCTPVTCEASGRNCGEIADGCGHTIACGECASPMVCGAANVCVAAACEDACTAGAKACEGDGVRTCARLDTGCLGWSAAVACDAGLTCSGGACVASCSDQCNEGTQECVQASTRTCVRAPSGCTEWTVPAACPAHASCSNGACVTTCSDQCSEGSTRCDGNGVQFCARANSGCLEWGATAVCSQGTCVNGACVKACSDRCNEGATECDGTGVRTCRRTDAGCTDWDTAVACPQGACASGACVPACTDPCVENATRCASGGLETCRLSANGCLDWSAPLGCPRGSACAGGTCVVTCTDQCSDGATRCATGGVETCRLSATGCFEWDAAVACPANEACAQGVCVHSCADRCAAGTTRCADGGVQSCGASASGCLDWGSTTSCPANTTCSAGSCVAACSDRCTEGAKRCGTGGVETCARAANGCTDWGAGVACGSHEICSNGSCVATCADACTAGAKRCASGGVQQCEVLSTGCLGWSAATACTGAHEVCSDGACVATCTDACTAGTNRCSGTGIQSCQTLATGCTGWSTAAPCPRANETCSGGSCVATCTNQCTEGAQACSAEGVITCVRTSTGCTDWDLPVACSGAHEQCTNGVCVATCSDICAPGTSRCAGTGIQHCATMPSGCTDWDSTTSCPGAHEACTDGACVATCTDACTAGARRCGTGGVETCAVAASGCTAWGAAIACSGAHEVCSGAGNCVATCTDACTLGATRCSGTSVQSCVVLTSGCSGWNTATACANANEACIGSSCVRAFAIGGEVHGYGGSGLVLKNGSDSLSVTAEGAFTFPTRLADGASYAVTVGTQPAWGQCTVTNAAGTVAKADVTSVVVTCTPVVMPLYPGAGRSWRQFVQNDGPSPLLAKDQACNPASISAASCLHGGELRKVVVPGRSSCTGLSATDALGAFTWTCDASTNPVRVVSTGLAPGKGMRDLLDFSAIAWRPNAVSVRESGTVLFTTTPAAWWTNPVVTLLASKTTTAQSDYGKVFLVTASRQASLEVTTADAVSVVTAPGVTLGGGGSSAQAGVTSTGLFNWFEGSFDANGTESALWLLGARFNTVHRATLVGGWGAGLKLEQWFSQVVSSNTFRDVTVGGSTTARPGVRITGGRGNLFAGLTVTGSSTGVTEDTTSTDERFLDLDVHDNGSDGANLAGVRTAVRGLKAIHNTNSGLVLGGAGASVVGAAIADNQWTGLVVKGENTTVGSVFATQSGFRNGPSTQAKATSGIDVVGANALLFDVAVLNSWGYVGGVVLETGGAMTASDVAASEVRTIEGITYPPALQVNASPGTRFTGILKIGSKASAPCTPSGTTPGITSQCQPVAPSDHVLAGTLIDLKNSFSCVSSGTSCEWSLLATDTLARDVLALPAATDTLTHTWKNGTTATFLRHAIELANDGTGDEDGLCEANEACLWTPNLGSYQGHGALVPVVTLANGIALWKYEVNGR